MINLLNDISQTAMNKIIINVCILIVIVIGTVIFLRKVKFESKSYQFLFISYILFWFSIMLVRQYRNDFQKQIDPSLIWVTSMIYGLVGVFFRPFFDFFQVAIKNRKAIIYIALGIQFITLLPIIFIQNQTTSIVQAAGIGIGASLIATYELLFKEQYGKSKSFMTVSILAFPPLIADFAAAPIQSIIYSFAVPSKGEFNPDIMAILWIVAIAIMPITFCITLFTKEDRCLIGIKTNNTVIDSSKKWGVYVLLLFIGLLITFIKFSNSGVAGKLNLEHLEKFTTNDANPFLNAYLSTIFSSGQIIGTFVFAWMSLKNVNKNKIFIVGISVWISYHIISLFIYNPYVFFGIHILNGFSYGILYNLILGYVLSYSFKSKYFTPIGIYQAVSSIGITTSTWFNTYLKENIFVTNDHSIESFDKYKSVVFLIDSIILGAIVILTILYGVLYYIEDYKKKKNKTIEQISNIDNKEYENKKHDCDPIVDNKYVSPRPVIKTDLKELPPSKE